MQDKAGNESEKMNGTSQSNNSKGSEMRGGGMRGPGMRGMRGSAKPKHAGKTIKRLLKYMGEYQVLFVFVVICILFNSGSMVAGTYLLRPALNNYIIPLIGQQNPDISGFVKLLFLMLCIYLSGVIASYLQNRIMLHISTRTLFKIRTQMFAKMETLPLRYFDTHTHGVSMSLYTNDTDTLRDMLSQSVPSLFSSAFTVVSVFVMMLILSPVLTLVVILMIFLMIFVTGQIGKRSGKAFRDQQMNIGKVNGYIEEMIEGQKVVKVFCREAKTKEQFAVLNDELCKSGTRANTLANILMPLMGNLSHINYAVTAIVGSLMTITGHLDLGTIASFLQYTRTFSQPITQMSQQMNGILNALAGAERIFALIDEQPETDDGYVTLVNVTKDSFPNNTTTGDSETVYETADVTDCWAWKHPHGDGSLTYTKLAGAVEFADVTFGYEKDKTVLHDISLFAEPGQKIALVGSTGSGKTTITNLINRFYDVPDGKIRYDGINVNKIKKDDLRRSLGMVLQDTHLFTGSVMDNIRYGNLNASDEEIIEAAKLANADSFIRHLPDGYNTVLSADGGNLSQGQRQLLSIARAAVANPPVLILDEATSSIDTRTEALIEKGMDRLMQGRTVFVIAHRLSTVRNADKILVLEQGHIIERGNHEALLKEKGRYYKLYTGMFELD